MSCWLSDEPVEERTAGYRDISEVSPEGEAGEAGSGRVMCMPGLARRGERGAIVEEKEDGVGGPPGSMAMSTRRAG
jgi:hypothetical protein